MLDKKTKCNIQYQWQIGQAKNNGKQKILGYLELFTKIIGVVTILAIVIGGFNIYSYLNKINYLFLFPDVVGLSYASISTLVAYFLLLLYVGIGFISPFLSHIFLIEINELQNKSKEKQKKEIDKKFNDKISLININPKIYIFFKNIINIRILKELIIVFFLTIMMPLLIIIPLIAFLALFLVPILIFYGIIKNIFLYKVHELSVLHLSKFMHWGFFWSVLILNILFFSIILLDFNKYLNIFLYMFLILSLLFYVIYNLIFINNIKNNKNRKDGLIYAFFLAFLQVLPAFMHFTSLLLPTIDLVNNLNWALIFYLISILIFSICLFISHIAFCDYHKSKSYYILYVAIIAIFSISYTSYLTALSNYKLSLQKLSFIEKPQDSSWYLIHNGNTASETINGMNSGDIENKKRIFNNKDCNDDWCKDDVSVILEQRQNALYGYMAWNLGDTKVFCPASVDFFDGTDNTEKSKKCLVIDGRYLQLTSNYYIGNAITQ